MEGNKDHKSKCLTPGIFYVSWFSQGRCKGVGKPMGPRHPPKDGFIGLQRHKHVTILYFLKALSKKLSDAPCTPLKGSSYRFWYGLVGKKGVLLEIKYQLFRVCWTVQRGALVNVRGKV